MIGCEYFHTHRQTEPNRSPPSKSVTVFLSFSHSSLFFIFLNSFLCYIIIIICLAHYSKFEPFKGILNTLTFCPQFLTSHAQKQNNFNSKVLSLYNIVLPVPTIPSFLLSFCLFNFLSLSISLHFSLSLSLSLSHSLTHLLTPSAFPKNVI